MKMLFASEVSLCRLNRLMAKQELYLFYFAYCLMTKARAGSAQIVRRHGVEFRSTRSHLNDRPDNFWCKSIAPWLARFPDCSKEGAIAYCRLRDPRINGSLDPIRHRYRAKVPTLPDKISNYPTAFTSLQML